MNQTLPSSTPTGLQVQGFIGSHDDSRWALLRLLVAAALTVAALAAATVLAG